MAIDFYAAVVASESYTFSNKQQQNPRSWFQIFLFSLYLGKIPTLTNIFSDGLVQPPTSLFIPSRRTSVVYWVEETNL